MNLDGPSAKVKWAEKHIDLLRSKIPKQSSHKHEGVPLTSKFESADEAVVFRLQQILEIEEEWSFILGDAIHSLRCALDYLAWQLFLGHTSGEATNPQIERQVKFPICLEKREWAAHPHAKYMDLLDAARIEKHQPFMQDPTDRKKGVLHPLAGLKNLSNVDKHREVHPAYFRPVVLNYIAAPEYADCTPPDKGPTFLWSLDARNPGDEIFRFPVTVTGPNPSVYFPSSMTGYVAFAEKWDVVDTLDALRRGVEAILAEF